MKKILTTRPWNEAPSPQVCTLPSNSHKDSPAWWLDLIVASGSHTCPLDLKKKLSGKYTSLMLTKASTFQNRRGWFRRLKNSSRSNSRRRRRKPAHSQTTCCGWTKQVRTSTWWEVQARPSTWKRRALYPDSETSFINLYIFSGLQDNINFWKSLNKLDILLFHDLLQPLHSFVGSLALSVDAEGFFEYFVALLVVLLVFIDLG